MFGLGLVPLSVLNQDPSAKNLKYDDTVTGLGATNAQDAIQNLSEVVDGKVESVSNSVYSPGVNFNLVDNTDPQNPIVSRLLQGTGILLDEQTDSGNKAIRIRSTGTGTVTSVNNSGAATGTSLIITPFTTTPTARKLIAGANITFTETNTAGQESLTILSTNNNAGSAGDGEAMVPTSGAESSRVKRMKSSTAYISYTTSSTSPSMTTTFDETALQASLFGYNYQFNGAGTYDFTECFDCGNNQAVFFTSSGTVDFILPPIAHDYMKWSFYRLVKGAPGSITVNFAGQTGEDFINGSTPAVSLSYTSSSFHCWQFRSVVSIVGSTAGSKFWVVENVV